MLRLNKINPASDLCVGGVKWRESLETEENDKALVKMTSENVFRFSLLSINARCCWLLIFLCNINVLEGKHLEADYVTQVDDFHRAKAEIDRQGQIWERFMRKTKSSKQCRCSFYAGTRKLCYRRRCRLTGAHRWQKWKNKKRKVVFLAVRRKLFFGKIWSTLRGSQEEMEQDEKLWA